jgi:hypothetical protein
MDGDIPVELERRLGRAHARQRLGIEADREANLSRFHDIESWYSIHSLIRNTLRLSGLYRRGLRNAETVIVRENEVRAPDLPPAFDGFTLLHLTDLHVDISPAAMRNVRGLIAELKYDLCVMTGDYRGPIFGDFAPTLEGMAALRAAITAPTYAVLGNHDTVKMVPGLEAMGIRLLMNESVVISRDGTEIHLAGVDDGHSFRLDNIAKASEAIPADAFSILLSHTPELCRRAAHAGFALMLSGHTHGGQICLPGRIAVKLDVAMPRRFGVGAWRYRDMAGYTSPGAGTCVVPVRFNCPPEVTLHRLRRA